MKRIITIICLALSGLIILDSLQVGYALAMFLVAGVIPGTNLAISANSMLVFYGLVLGFVVARLVTSRTISPPVNQSNA